MKDFSTLSGFTIDDVVEEGFFANPEQSVAEVLSLIRGSVQEKITTLEEAVKLSEDISDEAVGFNELLNDMANAIREFKAGNISKEDMLAVCTPIVKELQTNCKALKLVPGDIVSCDEECCCDIGENEIASLREVIIGTKVIIDERIAEIKGTPGADNAGKAAMLGHAAESYFDFDEFEEEDVAEEGLRDKISTLFTPNVSTKLFEQPAYKQALMTMKQAKKYYGDGDKTKAIETIKKAQDMFQKCLDAAKKMFADKVKTLKSTNTVNSNMATGHVYDLMLKSHIGTSQTFDATTTSYGPLTRFVSACEDNIDACRAYALQWTNKAGKQTLAETKKMLKDERKANKAKLKEERAAAKAEAKARRAEEREAKRQAKAEVKAAKNNTTAEEAYLDDLNEQFALESAMGYDLDTFDTFDEALESYVDEVAMECDLIIEDRCEEICL